MLSHLEHVPMKVGKFTLDFAETGSKKVHKLKLPLTWYGESEFVEKLFAFGATVGNQRIRLSVRSSIATEAMAHGVARVGKVSHVPTPVDQRRKVEIPLEIHTGELAELEEWIAALVELVADHLSVGVWSLQWAEKELAEKDAEREARANDAPGQGRIEDVAVA